MTSNYKNNPKCVCCGSVNITTTIKLEPCPLSDNYQDSSDKSMALTRYPCNFQICSDCGHGQLENFVEPDESYTDYIYKSRVTLGLNVAFEEYAKKIREMFGEAESIALLDVGSNDGSFINSCLNNQIKGYGVEPAANLVEACRQRGLNIKQGFFDKNFEIQTEDNLPEKFDAITFNNVLANIPNPQEALDTAKKLLKNIDSLIAIQTGYHPIQFSKGLFDYIYHEHFSYFSINSLNGLGNSVGLKLVYCEKLDLRGGSIRAFFKKSESTCNSITIPDYERFSCKSELSNLKYLINYSSLSLKVKLDEYMGNGYQIIGFGASHSTGMLVHMFKLEKYLAFLIDENKDKIGKYMPGTQLIVKTSDDLKPDDKTIVIVLAWQYYEQIKTKLIRKGFAQDEILKPMLP